MAFVIKVKSKDLEIKFNYKLLFLANKKLATKDENGNNQENGAANLFNNITDRKDSAIHDLIELSYSGKLSENDIIDAVGEYMDENGYEETFEEIEAEMLNSGFFLSKVKKQIEDMKFSLTILEKKETEEAKDQREAIKAMQERLEKKILSHNAPDKD